MRIIIDNEEIKTKSGSNEKGPWAIRTQVAYVDMGKRYPNEIKIRLNDDHKSDSKVTDGPNKGAWKPGEYTVDDDHSHYVSKYGSLALSEEMFLVPAAVAVKQAVRAAG